MAHITALPNQDRVRVLAADNTSMSTQLLVEALGREAQFQMIESPSNAPALVALVKREKPQVAVLSAKPGETGVGGYDLVREIRAESPSTRVVMLLDASERASVIEAFRAGARGVFCRTEPFRLLGKCIQCVHQGQVWASSGELHYVLEALAKPTLANFQINGKSLLSVRELDVVRCVAEGLTNREIAQRLKLTEHTVKNYLFRIFDKLGVSSRVEVVLYALGNSPTSNSAAPNTRRESQSAGAPLKPGTAKTGMSNAGTPLPVMIRKSAT